MGLRTEVSTNRAMTLGGLEEGVTPLEMAHAYSTIANRGVRVSGTLAASPGGPVAIERVGGGDRDDRNEKRSERVFPQDVGETAHELLAGVVSGGTGTAAADRRVRRREDGHHRELRRRLVRRASTTS